MARCNPSLVDPTVPAGDPADPWEQESSVRSYSRNWPVVLSRGVGTMLYSADDRAYLDFLRRRGRTETTATTTPSEVPSHGLPANDGIIHSLDMWTEAKADFLRAFRDFVLIPPRP